MLAYELTAILAAVEHWEKHKAEWLRTLHDARQTEPSEAAMNNYREIWFEAFLIGYEARNH